MLTENTQQKIVAYVLNCPVNDAAKRQVDAVQQADIEQLQQSLEFCIEEIIPILSEQGQAVVEEKNYPLFSLMPSNMAIKLVSNELYARGIELDADSIKQSLALALDNSSGYILNKL